MKIAVQLYGHLRTFEQCYPHLKRHLLDRYDCDVFLHTWSTLEHGTKTWHSAADKRSSSIPVDDTVLQKVTEAYQPKKIKVDVQDFIEEQGFLGLDPAAQISLKGMKYMLFSQQEANGLRRAYEEETGVVYDYVLVTRPDIMLLGDFRFEDYQAEFSFAPETSVHFVFAVTTDCKREKFFTFGTMDVLYIAPPLAMNLATQGYTHFDRFYKTYPQTVFPGGIGCPELSFHEHLLRHGVIPRLYRFPMCIKRKDPAHDIVSLPSEPEITPPSSFAESPDHTASTVSSPPPPLKQRGILLLKRCTKRLLAYTVSTLRSTLPPSIKRALRRGLRITLRVLHRLETF